MSEVFSIADCVEVDVTYKSCYELPYLFNVVAFNYLTMRCKWTSMLLYLLAFFHTFVLYWDGCWTSENESH